MQIGTELTIDYLGTINFKGMSPLPGKLPIHFKGYWKTSMLNNFYDEVGVYLAKH